MSVEVGSIIEGTVTGITNFGAFVELPENKVGLIHISEVSNVYVRDVRDFLKEQDKVKVKVLSIDPGGKISLSIKQTMSPVEETARPQVRSQNNFAPRAAAPRQNNAARNHVRQPVVATFEDKMKKFLTDSDDRLTDLKRNTESKRGGRGASHKSG